MTTTRAVPASLAPLLTQLELERPTVVTYAWIKQAMQTIPVKIEPVETVSRLRRLGWLLPLRVRDAWEFAPADRAGALSGGDPFIELRAFAAVRPTILVGVGLESAAFLQSMASRQPMKEVLIFEQGAPVVRALDEFRRVDLTLPDDAYRDIGGLRVQTPAAILATIAVRSSNYRDWPGLGEWLTKAAAETSAQSMVRFLAKRPAAAWARAAYLLRAGGNSAASDEVLTAKPVGSGPFFLGPRKGGVHDPVTDVIDSVVSRYAGVGRSA